MNLLEMALTDEGYRVLTAANGRQGLERLAEGPHPDLVISYYVMPVLDGAGLLQTMEDTEAHRDIPLHLHNARCLRRTCAIASRATRLSSASPSSLRPHSSWLPPS